MRKNAKKMEKEENVNEKISKIICLISEEEQLLEKYSKIEKILTELKTIQKDGINIKEAKKGEAIAIALPNVTMGRQIHEFDILYSDIKEKEFLRLKKLKKYLNEDEVEILKEITEIKRKQDPMWGI